MRSNLYIISILLLTCSCYGSSQGFLDERDAELYESTGFEPDQRPNEYELRKGTAKGMDELLKNVPNYLEQIDPKGVLYPRKGSGRRKFAPPQPQAPPAQSFAPQNQQRRPGKSYKNPYIYDPPPQYPYRE